MIILANSKKLALGATPLLALLSTIAYAHPGHDTNHILISGFIHPITGIDHLLAMLAIGLWSALSLDSLKKAIIAPANFALLLLAGTQLGTKGLTMPYVEPLILSSLLVLGLLLVCRTTLPVKTGAVIAGIFALAHGLAHGMELPGDGSAILFIIGFMISTLLIQCTGLLLGFILKTRSQWPGRIAGAGIALYGASLMVI